MNYFNTPIPDVRTTSINDLKLPDSLREEFPPEYWSIKVSKLPPNLKTRLCHVLSCGYRTKIVMIYQLVNDPLVDINFNGRTGNSIPEELVMHNMNLDIIGPQLSKRFDIKQAIRLKCNTMRPGTLTADAGDGRDVCIFTSSYVNRKKIYDKLMEFFVSHDLIA